LAELREEVKAFWGDVYAKTHQGVRPKFSAIPEQFVLIHDLPDLNGDHIEKLGIYSLRVCFKLKLIHVKCSSNAHLLIWSAVFLILMRRRSVYRLWLSICSLCRSVYSYLPVG